MRVLVVEDEVRMAELLRIGLEDDGYAVDVTSSGEDALWLADEHDYDVGVVDIGLPGLDGFELCRRLRAKERWMPVLVLSARDGIADRVTGLDAGADDYLVKPFAFSELTARLRALLRRGDQPRPVLVQVGDLVLDPATHLVHRGGTLVELTAKEFAVLELLMRNAGVALSRTRVLEDVWDFAFEPASNIVDQYVGSLRRKVDRPFGRDDLQTVRGVGYRLRARS